MHLQCSSNRYRSLELFDLEALHLICSRWIAPFHSALGGVFHLKRLQKTDFKFFFFENSIFKFDSNSLVIFTSSSALAKPMKSSNIVQYLPTEAFSRCLLTLLFFFDFGNANFHSALGVFVSNVQKSSGENIVTSQKKLRKIIKS